ncbi:AbrB/MazE/SpoVT family DNA-binding domain-containing protein [Nostoc sp.]|uniref:AbrB/MazE/SpoVT family DNA-binding domain-containing protein n=1 Tax=Nostoc sp. TaxID=1180 RepID=UPI002FFB3FBD
MKLIIKENNNQICPKMANQKLTLEIPESLFEQLHHLAKLTGQSIESLALQSITSNLPCLSEKIHDLDELLTQVTPDNLHSEIDSGKPVGHEIF